MIDLKKMDECKEFLEYQIDLYNKEDEFADEFCTMFGYSTDAEWLFQLTQRDRTIIDMLDMISGNPRHTSRYLYEEFHSRPLTYEKLKELAVKLNNEEDYVKTEMDGHEEELARERICPDAEC